MRASAFPADPSVALRGSFDLPQAIQGTPSKARTKGMFFARLQVDVGEGWDAVARTLDAPPKHGRYVSFAEYPSRDHVRLIDAAARAHFPNAAAREAHRRLGAMAVEDFVDSTIGRVTMQFVERDPAALLKRFPDGYALFVKGTRPVRALALDGGGMRIAFEDFLGVPEYIFGQLEAIVGLASATPSIEVSVDTHATTYDVRWVP